MWIPESSLFDYQREAVQTLDGLYEDMSVRRGLVVMATGLGKTVVFSHMRCDGRMLVVTHMRNIVEQIASSFAPDRTVGVLSDGHEPDGRPDVVVATVQSLSSKGSGLFSPDDFDTLVIDEAHHAVAPTYQQAIRPFRFRRQVGFTATTNRTDEQPLGGVFDRIVFERDLLWGIRRGYLADIDCQTVTVDWDTTGLAISPEGDDFSQVGLDSVVRRERAMADVVQAYFEYAEGPTLLFATSVAHSEALANGICRGGGKAKALSYKASKREREEVLRSFHEGDLDCLVNYNLFTEGTDFPFVRTVMLARPTASELVYTQMVGRGVRAFDGARKVKDRVRLIDCVGISHDSRVCVPASLVGRPKGIAAEAAGFQGLISEYEEYEEEKISPARYLSLLEAPRGSLRAESVDVEDRARALVWRGSPKEVCTLTFRGFAAQVVRNGLGLYDLTIRGAGIKPGSCDGTYESFHDADFATFHVLEEGCADARWGGVYERARVGWDMRKVRAWGAREVTMDQRRMLRELYDEHELEDMDVGHMTRIEASNYIGLRTSQRSGTLTRRGYLVDWGTCRACGAPMVLSKTGKTLQCSTNRWVGSTLCEGDGFAVYTSPERDQEPFGREQLVRMIDGKVGWHPNGRAYRMERPDIRGEDEHGVCGFRRVWL